MATDDYSFLVKNRDHHEIIIYRFRELPWWFIITGDTHFGDVIMGAIASQITNLTIVYSTVYSDADQKHQSSASLAFVWGIHRGPVNSPHKWPVTRKMFPFDDVIMVYRFRELPWWFVITGDTGGWGYGNLYTCIDESLQQLRVDYVVLTQTSFLTVTLLQNTGLGLRQRFAVWFVSFFFPDIWYGRILRHIAQCWTGYI